MQDTTLTQQNTTGANPQGLLSSPVKNDGEAIIAEATDIKVAENHLVNEKETRDTETVTKDAILVVEAIPKKKSFLPSFLTSKQSTPSDVALLEKRTDIPQKKTLPSHVKDHFEANSSAFVAFAQKKDIGTVKQIERSVALDEWDKALLLGEYPEGNHPIEIRTPEKTQDLSAIPKKPTSPLSGNILPNQILPVPVKEFAKKETVEQKNEPIDITTKRITLPLFVPHKPKTESPQEVSVLKQEKIILPHFIPRKTQNTPMNTQTITIPENAGKNTPSSNAVVLPDLSQNSTSGQPFNNLIFSLNPQDKTDVPQKTTMPSLNTGESAQKKASTLNNESSAPEPGMGEMLQKKIIEGQMKSVFENAPEGVRENMEKMLARDILSVKELSEETQNPDTVWKKRLRDYIIKLKWQGKTAFKNISDTDPKENETVASFIQRIYPSIIKVEMKEE